MSRSALRKSAFPPVFLDCGVQHYDWGEIGPGASIPKLMGKKPLPGKPYAELWIGAHALKPARIQWKRSPSTLDTWIHRHPREILGAAAAKKFGGRLPFLMKVIAASRALSIQAHPNKRQAEAGFARENAAGAAPNAPHRNYKDDNHKPEVIVALTDFYALNRFRHLNGIAEEWRRVPEFKNVMPDFPERLAQAGESAARRKALLKELYQKIMTLPQKRVDRILAPLVRRLELRSKKTPFRKNEMEYWFLKADREYSRKGRRDRGLFSFYLLNFVHLEPGQASYLGAGELHAYLEGVGVEVMANSDNVLRGGLTPKHIDIPELLKTLTFNMGVPGPILPDPEGIYATPAEEFEVAVLRPGRREKPLRRELKSVELLLTVKGKAELKALGRAFALPEGSVLLIPAAVERYQLRALSSPVEIYRCAVPLKTQSNGKDEPTK